MGSLKIRRVCFLSNASKPTCVQAEQEAEESLRKAGFDVVNFADGGSNARPDLILLLGGDGFLMECLHRYEFPEIPIFGINFGTVGFLMNPQGALARLPSVLKEGLYDAVDHCLLRATVGLEDGREEVHYAFNEFVLERQTGQAVRLQVEVDGLAFNRFAGDGFILSTPAGSTAYNLAAGGPAVHPGVQGILLTPLYPHRAEPFHSVQFSLMLPLSCRIAVVSEDLPKRHARLVTDGRPVDDAARVDIEDSGRRVTLLRTRDQNFIQSLSRKFMGWRG